VSYPDWHDTYQSRLRTPAQAAELIQANDLVGLTILAPGPMTQSLEARARELGQLNIRFLAPTELPLFDTSAFTGEREIEIFIGDTTRPMHDAKVATYLPTTFTLGMKPFDAGRDEARIPDVWMTPCSPPNEAGYVHFGAHMWLRKSYARRCKTTIAYIDPNMMPVHGDVYVHVSQIACFVDGAIPTYDMAAIENRIRTLTPEADRERMLKIFRLVGPDSMARLGDTFHALPPDLLESTFKLGPVDAETQGIADNLRQIIRDGDTIQVGVGEPSQLMFRAGAFDDAKHLGLHTELGSPGLAKLWARGILDNSRKSIHKGKNVAVAWSGCDGEDMAIIRDNPQFELHEPSDLLNPIHMGLNHQMTSINSAIAVDLIGQIASEDRFGGNVVNGTGGQPDTHISAVLSKTGRAITVMKSTAVGGTISKVVAKHDAGTMITIPRYFADTIITEHGIARLMDKNHRQRAEELISIAHPDFRAELRAEAKKLLG